MSGPVNDKEIAAQISKLYELHQSGALTKSEFENAKHRLLGETPRTASQPSSAYAPPQEPYQKPRERSALFHFARGFMICVAGFVAGFVALVIAIAIFTDNGDSSENRRSVPTATTEVAAAQSTEAPQSSDDDDTVVMRGEILVYDQATCARGPMVKVSSGARGPEPIEFVAGNAPCKLEFEMDVPANATTYKVQVERFPERVFRPGEMSKTDASGDTYYEVKMIVTGD